MGWENKGFGWGNSKDVSSEHTWLVQEKDWSGTSWQERQGEDVVRGVV